MGAAIFQRVHSGVGCEAGRCIGFCSREGDGQGTTAQPSVRGLRRSVFLWEGQNALVLPTMFRPIRTRRLKPLRWNARLETASSHESLNNRTGDRKTAIVADFSPTLRK